MEFRARWTSVKDGLPEEDGDYWVCQTIFGKWRTVNTASFSKRMRDARSPLYGKKNIFWQSDYEWGDYEHDNITHWMPLPPLPEDADG